MSFGKTRRARSSNATEFLRAVTSAKGYGSLVAIDPQSGTCVGRGYSANTLTKARDFIDAHNKFNLYWTPNRLGTLLNKKPTKADITAMRWVHLDLDDPSNEALERILAYDPLPTLIVFSGGGYNVYWQLAKPVHANGNIEELEAANRRVMHDLGAGAGTHNLDRILRLPGTTNWPTKTKLKRGRVPIVAKVIEHHPERRYQLSDFASSRDVSKATPDDAATDRSRDLLAKVSSDVDNELTDTQIHEKRDCHPHAADQSDPARAVQRCIDKARKSERREVEEAPDLITEINAQNALVWVGGRLLVMWPEKWDDGLPRLSTLNDIRAFWKRRQSGRKHPIEKWLRSEKRREYDRLVFSPGREIPGAYNLFQGWGVEPLAGDCSRFLKHLLRIICAGDEDLFDYVIQWLANLVQTPDDKPGTALALGGKQGTGKGEVARYVRRMLGTHFRPLSGSDLLLGRFNDTIANKLCVFGDESAWPGDRRGIDKLKAYITEPYITLERKNVPAFEIENFTRFIFATNSVNSAPAEYDDRRFVPLLVSDARIGDAHYWARLETERKAGGPAALLHHLLHNVKLTRILRSTPKTTALANQKLLNLDHVGQFVRALLMTDTHRFGAGFDKKLDRSATIEIKLGKIVETETLHNCYLEYAQKMRFSYPEPLDAFGTRLRRYLDVTRREARMKERKQLGFPEDKRFYVYTLPTLELGRQQFENALGQPVPWDDQP